MYRTARTTPLSRAFLVAEAERIGVTRNMGVSRRTVQRWRRRAPDFSDRSCRPQHSPRRSSDVLEAQVLAVRMERRWGPDRIGPWLGLAGEHHPPHPASPAGAPAEPSLSSTNPQLWPLRRDGTDQLSAVTKSGQTLPSFTYDAAGRRQKKTLGATVTSYLYDGANAVQELTGASPSANMLTGLDVDEVFQRTETATTRTFLSDALGNTLALADQTGVVQTSYSYAPYGATTFTGTASNSTSQFTGRENDNDSLYFYRARYYHPVMSRFVSEDPLGFAAGDANLYAYTAGGPTNFTDPSGLILPWLGACAFGAVQDVATEFVLFLMAGGRKENAPTHGALAATALMGCGSGMVGLGVGRYVVSGLKSLGVLPIGLREASKAAFRAADKVADWKVSLKHVAGMGGGARKFAAGVDPHAVVAEALRSQGAMFMTNPTATFAGTFRVVANLGRVVGTKGEMVVRVVVKYPGRVITAFPVRSQ